MYMHFKKSYAKYTAHYVLHSYYSNDNLNRNRVNCKNKLGA